MFFLLILEMQYVFSVNSSNPQCIVESQLFSTKVCFYGTFLTLLEDCTDFEFELQ